MRFSPATGLFAALAIGAVAIGAHQHETQRKEEDVKANFLVACEVDYELDWCTEQATLHHKPCFRRNYRRQSDGIRNTADVYTLNGAAYRACLMDGYDVWSEAVLAKKRAEQAFLDEVVN